MDDFVAIAKASRVFGKAGELMLNLYDTFPSEIDLREPVWVWIDSLPVPLFIERFERRGRSGALAVFADIDTPARAEALLGLEIGFRETGLAGEDCEELYLEDLSGFAAVIHIDNGDEPGSLGDESRSLEGIISGFYDSELNPLFEVEAHGRTILIPAVEPFIISVDPDTRTVEFSISEELAGLNI